MKMVHGLVDYAKDRHKKEPEYTFPEHKSHEQIRRKMNDVKKNPQFNHLIAKTFFKTLNPLVKAAETYKFNGIEKMKKKITQVK